MYRSKLLSCSVFAWFCLAAAGRCAAVAAEPDRHAGPACLRVEDFFKEEVWTKVGAQKCLECHKAGGDAEDSKFILQDPLRDPDPASGGFLRQNRAAFVKMA